MLAKNTLKATILILLAGALIMASRSGIARGLRNNNPGNIRKTSDAWLGLKPDQSADAAFFQFERPEYGIRAVAKILRNYQTKYGLNTVADIISRWAPPMENDTGSYVRHVANALGVAPDEPINTGDVETLAKLVGGIIKHENGVNPYSQNTINAGIGMALA